MVDEDDGSRIIEKTAKSQKYRKFDYIKKP